MSLKIKDEGRPLKSYLLCECINHSMLNDEVVSLEFFWPGPAPKAGQFFLVKAERSSVFLARPLSVWQWEPELLRFLLVIRGRGTDELAKLRIGEKAALTGPLGRGWIDVSGGFPNGDIALVSGGVGIAPLFFLAKELGDQVFDFYAGFRSGPFSLDGIQPRSLIISSEDASYGLKGRIPDHFSPKPYNAVYACGPEPMLKIIAGQCKAEGIPCYLSLERHMACGTGACLGCTIKTLIGNKSCCVDGPVFNGNEVDFDNLTRAPAFTFKASIPKTI